MREVRSRTTFSLLAGLLLILTTAVVLAAEGGRLTGRVSDEDGSPIAGIRLRFVSQSEDGETVEGIETNKKGRFTTPDVRAGTYRIELETAGFRVSRFSLDVRSADGTPVADFAEDVPPGLYPTAFEVLQRHRLKVELVLARAEESDQGPTQTLAAALDESARLNELNRLFKEGNMAQLAEAAAAAVAEDPQLGGAWYLLGVARWQTGRTAEGVEGVRKALELSPDQPGVQGALGSALLDLGEQRLEQGDPSGAQAAFEEAADLLEAQCTLTPEDLTFQTNRVVALERLGRTAELPGAIQALLRANPDDLRAYLRLAEVYAELGERAKAIEALEAIPDPGHDTAVAMYNIAVEMYNDGDLDSMIMVLLRAVAIDPEFAELHRLLGRGYLSQGDNESAIAEMREFLRLAPDDPGAAVERELIARLERE